MQFRGSALPAESHSQVSVGVSTDRLAPVVGLMYSLMPDVLFDARADCPDAGLARKYPGWNARVSA